MNYSSQNKYKRLEW